MFDWMGLTQSLFTLGTLCVALAALMRSRGGDHDDDTEGRVRLEQGLQQLTMELAKLTAKMDQVLANMGDMQISVALLKESVKRAHERLNTHSDRLDVIEQAHYANVGTHDDRYRRTNGGGSDG